jgi:hypothetical protein
MPLQYFALDSTDGDHAARTAALASAAAANQDYTPAIVQRPAAHDGNIVLVAANVTEGQLTGDLEDLATINAICQARFVDVQELREFGFYLLDEPERSWNPKLTGGNVFLKHAFEGDGNGGDGKTPWTARSWYGVLADGGIDTNRQYVRTGAIFFHQHGTRNIGLQGQIGFIAGSAGDETVIRDDYSAAPGAQSDHYYHTNTSIGQEPWVQDGENPNVWSQSDFTNTDLGGPALVMGSDFPILGTSTAWHDDWILEQVGSLEDCHATPSSYFIDNPTVHVHLHDGASPSAAGRYILRQAHGWRFDPRNTEAALPQKVRLINCQQFGHSSFNQLLRGDSSNYNADKVTFEGGRCIWTRGDWFINGGCSERSWIASTVGRILWDSSDRRDHPASEGVQELVTPNETWASNMPASDWDRWKHHVEIGYCTVGPHPSIAVSQSQALSGFPDTFRLNGFYFHHFEDTKGFSRDNADRHPVAIRGGWSGTLLEVKHGYVYRAPNMVYWYAPGNGPGGEANNTWYPAFGATANITPYAIEDLVFDTWSGNLPTAGNFAVAIGGDSDAIPMDNGTGDRSGTVRRIVMLDHRPTGSTLGTSPAQEAGGHLFACSDSNTMIVDSTIKRCNWAFRADRASNDPQAFSSIQLVDDGIVDTDATATVVQGVNTPLEMPLTGTFAVVFGRQQNPPRRAEIRLTQNGAGGATIAWQYWNGAWTNIPTEGLTDGANKLTQTGTVSFAKPSDWAPNTIGTRTCYHFRAVVASAFFTTNPIMDRCVGVRTNFFLRARRIRVLEPEQGLIWVRANTYSSGEAVIDLDDITIRLKSGQDIETAPICRFFSSGGQETLAAFQARTKLAANTDAPEDSLFCPNVTILEPLAV